MISFPGKQLVRRTVLERVRRRLKCTFVLSTGRVGTDSLTRLLALSPEIKAHHEPIPQMLQDTKRAYQNPEAASAFAEQYLSLRYFSNPETNSLRACSRQGLIYVETSNRLTYIAHSLADYFPLSKFIFLHRNPPDVIRSAMRREYYQSHPWDRLRIEPREDDIFRDAWGGWTPFQKCCWYWQAVNQFAWDFLETLPPERKLNLPFTAILDGDMQAIRMIFEWLNVATPGESDLTEMLAIRHNAQESAEFPRWPQWTDQQKMQMTSIIGRVARQIGYDEYVSESPVQVLM